MTSDIEFIVLHHTRTGDASVVVHTLSKEYGRRSLFLRNGARGSIMAMFQPLSIIECKVSESGKSQLLTAKSPVLLNPLTGIRSSIYKNAISMFISEVLYRVLKDSTLEEGLYEWCRGRILLLNAMASDFSNFHLRFLLEFAVILGFAPSKDDLMPFAEDSQLVQSFLECSFEQTMLLPMTGETRARMADNLLKYIEFHTESTIHVNSLKVLHEILRT